MKKRYKFKDKNKVVVIEKEERNSLHFDIQRAYRGSIAKNKKVYTRKKKHRENYFDDSSLFFIDKMENIQYNIIVKLGKGDIKYGILQ